MAMSPERKREYMRNYWVTHKEKKSAYNKVYWEKHRVREIARNKQWYAANREKQLQYMKEWRLKALYDLSQDQYNLMLNTQNGVCAICSTTNKHGVALAVDHDHKTGMVRGLLCSKCNGSLGWYESNEQSILNYLMEAAINERTV